MSDKTAIQWADATWNPTTGCTRVSPGCDHCYIDRCPPFRMAHRRFDRDGAGGTTGVLLHPERLDQPLRWKRPRRVFVNSLSDLFHDEVPDEYIAQAFAVMRLAPQHTFQVLTKRPSRMRALLSSERFVDMVSDCLTSDDQLMVWPLLNVWLGVTTEDQPRADLRIPILLNTPAAVRFLSVEPMLGPVNLGAFIWASGDGESAYPHTLLDWVICGGESGPGARPIHPNWARSLRDQCVGIGIPFFFKQWGEWVTETQAPDDITLPAVSWSHLGDGQPTVWRVGKHAAGRCLDGRTWDEYPKDPR